MTLPLTPYAAGKLEREVVLARVIDAPRDAVFAAWIEPAQMFQWFGPAGYYCEVHQAPPAQVGAVWRFDMVSAEGQRYDNRMRFVEVVPGRRLVIEHGQDIDGDPNRFLLTLGFDSQGNGKTILTLRQFHPSAAQRERVIGFGAVELGYQTLDKLNAFVSAR